MNDRKQFTVIIHKASLFIKLHPRIFFFSFFFFIRCIECWVYLKALIAEAILVLKFSLYDEIRVNLTCRKYNRCVSLISIYNRDEAYLSDSGNRKKKTKYERKLQNSSMKNNNGDTQRMNAQFCKLSTITARRNCVP